jgi:hypothetical protein
MLNLLMKKFKVKNDKDHLHYIKFMKAKVKEEVFDLKVVRLKIFKLKNL